MKKSLRPPGSRAWVEVDTSALAHNYKTLRKHLSDSARREKRPPAILMSVVKSNAYGHGLMDCARVMEGLGVDWLGVDTIVEGLLLRREGRKVPILALGYTLPEKLEEAAVKKVSVTISNAEHLKVLKARNGKLKGLKVHIKVDTGMHRQGFLPEEIPAVLQYFKKNLNGIEIEGVYTHFAAAKNPAMRDSVQAQMCKFEKALACFRKAKISVIRHACNSGGTLVYPEAHLDMVRVGIALYGLWPEAATCRTLEREKGSRYLLSGDPKGAVRKRYLEPFFLTPALAWKTVVGEVKRIPHGGQVGYDLTEAVPPGTMIAICPVGYWHGLFRTHSSVMHVLIRGKRAKLVGRVSMDMVAVDVSGIKGVRMGDEVTIIGQDGKEKLTAEEQAAMAGTSNYELVTRINPFTKRVYF